MKCVFQRSKKIKSADLYLSKIEENKWKLIHKVNFPKDKKAREIEAFISLYCQKKYFTANNADFKDTKIWVVNHDWNHAIMRDSPINNEEVFNPII